MKMIGIYTTVTSLDEARRLASALVERRLAACAQISEIESYYRWDGAVQNEKEFRILFKTVDAQYPSAEAAIRELHPYELPAIHAVDFERVYSRYAQWVCENATGPG